MRLRAQLFGAEFVGIEDFDSELTCIEEAEGVEGDLSDHGVVRDHHCDCAEEGLEVVRELLSASIARVHGDEAAAGESEFDGSPFEHEFVKSAGYSLLKRHKLLGDNAEHFEIDAIELVKAAPRPTRGESFEELSHREVVQAFAAIEHHTVAS